MRKIIDYLQQLGLSKIEAQLYQGLLELGSATVMELAKHTQINRITAHFHAESLIQKGLVSQIKQGARRKLVVEDYNKLRDLIEKKKEKTRQLQKQFPEIMKTIHASFPKFKEEGRVQVKYYEGKNSVRSIYREVLKATEVRSYVNIGMVYRLFPENPQLFPQNVAKGRLKLWEIIEDSPKSRAYIKTVNPKGYLYKFFPQNIDRNIFFDYIIFDNKIAIITAGKDQPLGILINNTNIYKISKFIFDLVWSLLPEPKNL